MADTDTAQDFLRALSTRDLTNLERAVAQLWWHSRADHTAARTPRQLADESTAAGYPGQNVSRLARELDADPRTAKAADGAFRISIAARAPLDGLYGDLVDVRPAPKTDSVLPTNLFKGTRGYIEKVVYQLNASYSAGLFDCCAVMCRRLLETLIIEVYEAAGRANELNDPDGNFKMFSGLLAHLEADTKINLSRNAKGGLNSFKKLGDLSAHNRRFNAEADDIKRVRDELRVAAEELLHLANLKRPS